MVGAPSEKDLEVVPNPEVRDYIRKMIKPGQAQVTQDETKLETTNLNPRP